jgi:hypothetical protein
MKQKLRRLKNFRRLNKIDKKEKLNLKCKWRKNKLNGRNKQK